MPDPLARDSLALLRTAARHADPSALARVFAAGLSNAPAAEVAEALPQLYEEQILELLSERDAPTWAAFSAEIEEEADLSEIVRRASREHGAVLAEAFASNDPMHLLHALASAIVRAYAAEQSQHVARQLIRSIVRL